MSKIYVPSFLKNQSNTPSTRVWPEQNTNKFEALSDNFSMKKDTPIVNTSLPAKEAPKLVPATLASITSNGTDFTTVVGSGPKKSFASKFAEHAKNAEQTKNAANPHYVLPPKPVNVTSEDDFPSLGGPKKTIAVKLGADSKPVAVSFAEKAKEWAKQKEDEAVEAIKKAAEEEKNRQDLLLYKRTTIIGFNRCKNKYENNDYDDYNYDESSLGDDDSYEVPEEDEQPSEEEENEDEFNQNVGWDGRHKDDLY